MQTMLLFVLISGYSVPWERVLRFVRFSINFLYILSSIGKRQDEIRVLYLLIWTNRLIKYIEEQSRFQFFDDDEKWLEIQYLLDWMSNKVILRIKSAAFVHKQQLEEIREPERKNNTGTFTNIPITESRITLKERDETTNRKTSLSKIISRVTMGKTNRTHPSQVWKKIHSTRSEVRLKSINKSAVEQEPIVLNLLEKVDRLKGKHYEKQIQFENGCFRTQRMIMQRSLSLKKRGQREGLNKKIDQLLAPFEKAMKKAEERYKARLLKIKKV